MNDVRGDGGRGGRSFETGFDEVQRSAASLLNATKQLQSYAVLPPSVSPQHLHRPAQPLHSSLLAQGQLHQNLMQQRQQELLQQNQLQQQHLQQQLQQQQMQQIRHQQQQQAVKPTRPPPGFGF